jgi:hypothetical protein
MSNIRCANPDCQVLNRVNAYSINQMLRCSKCGWVLPESSLAKMLEKWEAGSQMSGGRVRSTSNEPVAMIGGTEDSRHDPNDQ